MTEDAKESEWFKTPGLTLSNGIVEIWVKFSERQPEKEIRYLCYCKDAFEHKLYVMDWYDGEFYDPFLNADDLNYDGGCNFPDYWAEINLPPYEEVR